MPGARLAHINAALGGGLRRFIAVLQYVALVQESIEVPSSGEAGCSLCLYWLLTAAQCCAPQKKHSLANQTVP